MRLFRSSSRNSSKEQSSLEKNRAFLYLNVYDLTPVNNYLYWFGLGIFHSGIEVHGAEYGYGAHDRSSSGVFEVEPRSCPGFTFRHSVLLGSTDMSRAEIRSFIMRIAGKYHGDTYHLITKNCNHFTNEVCMHLTGKPIPGWVNRLARVGSFCHCILPAHLQATTVKNLPDHQTYSEYETESDASSSSLTVESEDEHPDHLLLTAPANSRENRVRIIKEIR